MVWHQEELLMITKNMKIEISTGLEARPVAVFVQVASQFESSIVPQRLNIIAAVQTATPVSLFITSCASI